MTYLYSAKTNCFYPIEMKESYENSGTWPDFGVEVNDDVFSEFAGSEPPRGKMRGSDKKGYPCWVDIPPLTHEEHIEIAERKKQNLIVEVTQETEILRAKLALGRIKEDEKALLNAWLDYLDGLEAVDASTAPDIIWPVKPVV
ncbi:tail fiber assembly protein [Morganella morganii]|uniref:tail fiber assembly protein n=1 Tax=Morganella morganii TaxID=582 RepID=UPI000F83B298|nr:tail fiber assembly protein [Morganella morganii]RTY22130.1 tail fiber assembly protein [Morganella morganii subsp. morganii]